ncbi:uncharacterized protein EV422DRAFT_113801 [Fimicolochytrium jonesii]|uniref:uncharacterized protein n=1 Tax=Fimicolochytrium jonesii TaxID=1396493 RepID=UPI0022FE59B5|nr:uncharacterized protein EV422DRAFT_113801 [Fimicolochytrium jonesii]KAI8819461.1 hypothetical protein EV422DRAFT_113801 [Fimicolochytrium jonesii]
MAMQYLHSREVVHGDLKATNVLVDEKGTPKVSDFGFSRSKTMVASMNAVQNTNIATLRWAAPERLNGKPISNKTDVYAFGMLCYEIASEDVPFAEVVHDSVLIDLIRRGVRPERPERPHCSDILWALRESCWHQEPERRPEFSSVVRAPKPLIGTNLSEAHNSGSGPSELAAHRSDSDTSLPSYSFIEFAELAPRPPPITAEASPHGIRRSPEAVVRGTTQNNNAQTALPSNGTSHQPTPTRQPSTPEVETIGKPHRLKPALDLTALLHAAAREGQATLCLDLIVRLAADVNAPSKHGATPLHIAASRGHVETSRALLSLGANIEATMEFGRTPLHLAANHGHTEICHALIAKGARIEALTEDKLSPLHFAVIGGRQNTAGALLKLGANHKAECLDVPEASLTDGTPFVGWRQILLSCFEDASSSALEGITHALRKGTALHLSALFDQIETCKTLLDYGAKVDPEDALLLDPSMTGVVSTSNSIILRSSGGSSNGSRASVETAVLATTAEGFPPQI